MPPKKDAGKAAPAKKKDASSGGKAKKKKWSKGKVRDKLNNLVLFDKATYDKLYKEGKPIFMTLRGKSIGGVEYRPEIRPY